MAESKATMGAEPIVTGHAPIADFEKVVTLDRGVVGALPR
jgi:hypothetical protein